MTSRPPIPDDEPARVVALARMRLMDTEPDESLDALTLLASDVLGVPVALVSLIDGRRQWYKSKVGWDFVQTRREDGICAYAIHTDDVMVVPDVREDARFADGPLRSLPTPLTAYAGVALHSADRRRVGTLCVLDPSPRQWTETEQRIVGRLGVLAEQRLQALAHIKQVSTQLEERDEAYRIIAHDLSSPARQMVGLLELLTTTQGEVETLVPMALRSAQRLQHLSRGLKEYVQVGEPSTGGRVPLADVSREAWSDLPEVSGARLVLPDSLPVLPGSRSVFRVILTNLLKNAVEHAGRSGVEVRVSATLDGSLWRIAVTDNGVQPIDVEPSRLFRMFWQRQRDDEGRAVGTGLAIVRRLVSDMGCEVGAHQEQPSGLTVWFTWPALPEEA